MWDTVQRAVSGEPHKGLNGKYGFTCLGLIFDTIYKLPFGYNQQQLFFYLFITVFITLIGDVSERVHFGSSKTFGQQPSFMLQVQFTMGIIYTRSLSNNGVFAIFYVKAKVIQARQKTAKKVSVTKIISVSIFL